MQAEETARAETEARRAAESQKQMMAREMEVLKGRNQELATEVEHLTQLLSQKPKVFTYTCMINIQACINEESFTAGN